MAGEQSPALTHQINLLKAGQSPAITKGAVTIQGGQSPAITHSAAVTGKAQSPAITSEISTLRGAFVADFRKKYIRAIDRASMGFLFPEGKVFPGGPSAALDPHGILADITEQGTAGNQLDTSGFSQRLTTDGTLNDDAGWEANADFIHRQHSPQLVYKFRLPDVTSIRTFLGLSSQALSTTLSADDPGGHLLGLQFSTARDTNFQFVKRDGTTLTLIDSGIAPTTAARFFVIEARSASDIDLILLDENQARLAITTVTTGGPLATQGLRFMGGVRALVAAARSFDTFHAAIAATV